MAITALSLVTDALYMASLAGRGYGTPPPEYTAVGLQALNEIVAQASADTGMNPFIQRAYFTAEIGEPEYFIEDLIGIETLTFLFDSVVYPVEYKTRTQFFDVYKPTTIQTLPLTYDLERDKDGATIFLYPKPDKAYEFTMWAQFFMYEDYVFSDDLLSKLPEFYINYLLYATAETTCIRMPRPVPPAVTKKVAQYKSMIKKQISCPDYTITKMSTLSARGYFDWGAANLFRGYTGNGN